MNGAAVAACGHVRASAAEVACPVCGTPFVAAATGGMRPVPSRLVLAAVLLVFAAVLSAAVGRGLAAVWAVLRMLGRV